MSEVLADFELADFFRRYIDACNAHRFDALDEFVDEDVEVNGAWQGRQMYVAGLFRVVDSFPDYRWSLQHLLTDSQWVSAHYLDTGTHRGEFLGVQATEKAVRIHEFAVYRISTRKIVEVWVVADNLSLLDQLRQC